jgi:tetratricopeptide (TPR) repeat protein
MAANRTEAEDGNAAADAHARIGAGKLWAFRLIAVVVLPIALLALLELGLRVGGYGIPLGFALRDDVEGEPRILSNPRYTQPFFGPLLARPIRPFSLPAKKGPETVRIIVLGGSAAQGVPEPAFGMARILETLLEDQCPGTRFEVVNAAITAINSHVVLGIARECTDLEPDAMVLYLGNNEVVGPYGPGTVFDPLASGRLLIRAALAAKRTRVGQLLENAFGEHLARGAERPTVWRGMRMFLENRIRLSDPRLETTYEHFEDNLEDICRAGRRAGVPVIVSTVGVNLKDSSPFASLHRTGLTARDSTEWERVYEEGSARQSQGRVREAVGYYEEAEAIDGEYADLAFRLAQCHEALGDPERARAHYEKARDLDALRFRADSRINEIIRRVAGGRTAEGIYLADSERRLRAASPKGIPGRDLFDEHVHLRFRGNYLVARTLYETLLPALPARARQKATGRPVLTQEACAQRLPFTPVDRHDALETILTMLEQPPFTNRMGHDRGVAELSAEWAALGKQTAGRGLEEALATYERVLQSGDAHPFVRHRYAQIQLQHAGRPEVAEAEFRRLVRSFPSSNRYLLGLGRALAEQGKSAEAVECFERSLRLVPHQAAVHSNLGAELTDLGEPGRAVEHLARAVDLEPDNAAFHNNLATGLLKSGEHERALAHFRMAVEIDPTDALAQNNLGAALLQQGEPAPAREHFGRAVAADPENALYHHNLGRALALLQQSDAAVGSYRRALALNPEDAETHRRLGLTLIRSGRAAEAASHCGEAVRLSPASPAAHYCLGLALLRMGEEEEGLVHCRTAVRLRPGFAEAHCAVATVGAWRGDVDQASRSYETALRLRPESVRALNGLAWLLATRTPRTAEDTNRAVRLAERACRLRGQEEPVSLDTLAAAYAAAGRFPEAVTTQEKAIRVAEAGGKREYVLGIQKRDLQGMRIRLTLYQAGRPYRDPAE